MPVEMPVRQAPVPAGHRRGQPGQWEQSEETLTIPALEGFGEEALASGATEGSQVWDGRDVSFPPLRPSAGRPVRPGGETQTGERGTSQGLARSGCSLSESPPEPPSEPLWASAPVGSGRGRRAAQVLAVTGARGGLGASVLLLHLAWALGRAGRRVAMMDLDPTGGLDLLCGQSVLTGLRWADLPAEESAFRPGHLVGALPVWHAMPVLTGDVRGGPRPCAEAVLEAMRAEHDIVLVDLPRGAPPPPGARVLLITGLDLRSAIAAESIASRLRGAVSGGAEVTDTAPGAPVWLVVRQVGEDVVAEDLELITGCPVLGQVPTDRVLAKRLALGEDPVRARSAIRRAASALAQELLSRLPGAAASGPARGGAGPASGPAGAVAGQGDQEAGSQSTIRPRNRPMNQPTNQPNNQPMNQPKNQSRSQSWSR